jgi:hypothetical protein
VVRFRRSMSLVQECFGARSASDWGRLLANAFSERWRIDVGVCAPLYALHILAVRQEVLPYASNGSGNAGQNLDNRAEPVAFLKTPFE